MELATKKCTLRIIYFTKYWCCASVLHQASLSALARLSATLVALLGDRGEVGDTGDVSPRPCSARPFRAAERERFQKRTRGPRRLKRGTQPREQQPAAKPPKQRSALSNMAKLKAKAEIGCSECLSWFLEVDTVLWSKGFTLWVSSY